MAPFSQRLEPPQFPGRFTPAQLALAWLLHQGNDIFPIPGTRRVSRVDENAGASELRLSAEQLMLIDQAAPAGVAEGSTLV
ncbi:MAG: aldo/keto reductase [Betaproteobacteria bacterium]|nr:aldo/keto reductase [Betaproteobacteria bacterium]